MTQPPLIASFVVRLVHEAEAEPEVGAPPVTGVQTAGGETPWRVTVRHVQSGQELRFLRLEDALPFMAACAHQPVFRDKE
ncbi:MAG TPA: hypothetical protein VGK74_20240 [Symbiobacteriaceae bacterium]